MYMQSSGGSVATPQKQGLVGPRAGSVDKYFLFILTLYTKIRSKQAISMAELVASHRISTRIVIVMRERGILSPSGNEGKRMMYDWNGPDPTREMAEEFLRYANEQKWAKTKMREALAAATHPSPVPSPESQPEELGVRAILDELANVKKMLAHLVAELG